MTDRLISVVLPVYNGERFLSEALDSVLAQSWRPLELIVVDDGSTDGSAEVARRFPEVRYLRQDNAGQARARNAGVATASGEFLAFIDADDLWIEDKLEIQMAAFRSVGPTLDAVFGHAEEFLQPGTSEGSRVAPRHALPAQLPSAMLIRRAAFSAVGGFDPRWRLAETVDFYARLQEAGMRCLTLGRVVYRRRVHGRNTGVLRQADRNEYLEVVAAALARRRHEEGGRSAARLGAPPATASGT